MYEIIMSYILPSVEYTIQKSEYRGERPELISAFASVSFVSIFSSSSTYVFSFMSMEVAG
jgi:hypothetical protein